MALAIVWSHPSAQPQQSGDLHRIMHDVYGSVYVIIYADHVEEFELIVTRDRNDRNQDSTNSAGDGFQDDSGNSITLWRTLYSNLI
jgi:hypothetical protein